MGWQPTNTTTRRNSPPRRRLLPLPLLAAAAVAVAVQVLTGAARAAAFVVAPHHHLHQSRSGRGGAGATTRLHAAATVTRSRPRRRDLNIGAPTYLSMSRCILNKCGLPPGPHGPRPDAHSPSFFGGKTPAYICVCNTEEVIPEAPAEGDDEDLGLGGGGGKRWVRVYPVGLGKVGQSQPAVFLTRRREVRIVGVCMCVHGGVDVSKRRFSGGCRSRLGSRRPFVLASNDHVTKLNEMKTGRGGEPGGGAARALVPPGGRGDAAGRLPGPFSIFTRFHQ